MQITTISHLLRMVRDSVAHFNYTYFYYYGLVNNANSIISSLDVEGASESAKASAGVAYAYRALAYLDMARMLNSRD